MMERWLTQKLSKKASKSEPKTKGTTFSFFLLLQTLVNPELSYIMCKENKEKCKKDSKDNNEKVSNYGGRRTETKSSLPKPRRRHWVFTEPKSTHQSMPGSGSTLLISNTIFETTENVGNDPEAGNHSDNKIALPHKRNKEEITNINKSQCWDILKSFYVFKY